jgi:hypothetical protein
MSRAEDAGHEVTVITLDGSAKVYAGAAFVLDATGAALHVWRTDGTLTVLYAPGQWRAVMATGSGLGPG